MITKWSSDISLSLMILRSGGRQIGENGIVLDDADLFQGMSIDALLEIFPEFVTSNIGRTDVEFQAEMLTEMKERDEAEESELFSQLTHNDFQQEMCRRHYERYHYACAVTQFYIEDEQAQTGGGLLHVYLDEHANVVRQAREKEPDWIEAFQARWQAADWDDAPSWEEAEVGPAYLPGGIRGPPYGQRTPHWLQLCIT